MVWWIRAPWRIRCIPIPPIHTATAPGHVIRPGDEPVQRHRDIRHYFAHVSIPLSDLDVSVRSGEAPARCDATGGRSPSADYDREKIEYKFIDLNINVVDSGLVED